MGHDLIHDTVDEQLAPGCPVWTFAAASRSSSNAVMLLCRSAAMVSAFEWKQ
ncbi:hypothetical protein AB0F91_02810 [Amycolatopsis sp. NPDC023774]|uniref:hypothetical protein n=1 Tax=Amycolatopsis sp. NPDC023774 TaxID=3155015 RepID=UPI0033E246FA